jgi:hypothetical protein
VARDAAGAVIGTTIAAPQPLARRGCRPVQVGLAASTLEVVTERHAPVRAGMGNPFVLAEVTPGALSRAAPDLAAFRRAVAEWPVLEGRFALYLYSVGAEGLRARMFAPASGTVEDAATGSAAAPLAGLLLELSGAERGGVGHRAGRRDGPAEPAPHHRLARRRRHPRDGRRRLRADASGRGHAVTLEVKVAGGVARAPALPAARGADGRGGRGAGLAAGGPQPRRARRRSARRCWRWPHWSG